MAKQKKTKKTTKKAPATTDTPQAAGLGESAEKPVKSSSASMPVWNR